MQAHLATWPSIPGQIIPTTTNATADATTTTTTLTTTTTTTSTTGIQPLVPVAPVMLFPSDRNTWALSLLNQQKTGVPALHQTILDRDYEMASILLAAGADPSALVQPPLRESEAIEAQRRPAGAIVAASDQPFYRKNNLVTMPSRFELNNEKIVDFVVYTKAKSPQENLHFLGANALTLSLLSGAPSSFIGVLCHALAANFGALLNARDHLGRTPCGIAAALGHQKALKALLQSGADAEAKDGQGIMPVEHALINKQTATVSLMIEHGVGNPQNMPLKIDRLPSALEGPTINPFIQALLDHRDLTNLVLYEKKSGLHRLAMFKSLIRYCKHMLDNGSSQDWAQWLNFATPLLNPLRISKIAVAVARQPEQLPKLIVLLKHLGDRAFHKSKLSALRDAAGKSGDSEMLAFAIALDPVLTQVLSRSSPLNPSQQAKLNRLLALAMQTHSEALVNQLTKRGAVLNGSDWALEGLPMISILADYGDAEQLKHFIQSQLDLSGTWAQWELPEAIASIRSSEGLRTLFEAFGSQLSAEHLHQMLCQAVRLNDISVVRELMQRAGANLNYHFVSGRGLSDANKTSPVSIAIAANDLDLLKSLAGLGALIRSGDVSHGRASPEIAAYVDRLELNNPGIPRGLNSFVARLGNNY
jgi:ankyrin repeat protein